MSRCFPFPPPGYERKTTIDNAGSLTKENRKEKKDKKEKRDKEKREKKERKHKDRSKEKHGEKKDRKKDRDKKDKKKDKDRNNDKSRTTNDKVLEDQTIYHHFDNHGVVSQNAWPRKDFKSTEALESRVREGTMGNRIVKNANISPARNNGMGGMVEKERGPDIKMDRHPSAEKRIGGMRHLAVEGAINNSMVNNSLSAEQRGPIATGRMVEKGRTADAKMERRLPPNEGRTGAMGNILVERISSSNVVNFSSAEKRQIGTGRVSEKERATDTNMGRFHITNQKTTMVDGSLHEGSNGNNMGGKYIIAEQGRDIASGKVEEREMDGKIEKDAKKQTKQEEKTKDLGGHAKNKERQKDKDQNKNNKKRDRDKKKEKKNDTDKIRDKGENKEDEVIEAVKCAGFDGNLKRKQINGIMHENDLQPNKLARMASFSHLPVENGRKIEMRQFAIPTADCRGAPSKTVLERDMEHKGRRINGVVKSQLTTPSEALKTVTTDVKEMGEVSVKPHPDLKHLSLILSVPEMEEWPETVDQEWLFGSGDQRRISSGKTSAKETPQVWAKAVKIDEADVLALPYVIPY